MGWNGMEFGKGVGMGKRDALLNWMLNWMLDSESESESEAYTLLCFCLTPADHPNTQSKASGFRPSIREVPWQSE